MRRRIFIAINFPEDIKKKLAGFQEKWLEIPIRWTKPENLHITLVFVGYVGDEELLEICRTTKEVALRNFPFSVNLTKICYGPIKKIPPRMVWVVGEKSQEFASLREDLEKSLLASNRVSFSPENREFSPHITLGRIRQWEWRRVEPEERPEIEEDIGFGFPVDSIEVMESQLRRGGPKYTVLESFELGGN